MSPSPEVLATALPPSPQEPTGAHDDARKAVRRVLLGQAPRILPPQLAQVHAAGPCLEVWPGTYAVARMSSCRAVLKDRRFVVEDREIFARRLPDWRHSSAARSFIRELLSVNGEDHHQLREVMIADFLPPKNERMHDIVDRTVAEVLQDTFTALDSGATVDLDLVASRVPLLAVGRLLGVPDASADVVAPRIRAFSALIEAGFASPRRQAAADRAVDELNTHLRPLVAAKESAPDDGFISSLLAARHQLPEQLDDAGLLANVLLIFSAGYETTSSLLRSALRALVTDPPLAERVHQEPTGPVTFVREIERLHPAIPVTSRYASEDVDVEGVPVPAGSQVYVLIDAANRDPQAYPGQDLDTIRLDRRPGRSLTFGSGVRACLGVLMARAISELTIRTVTGELAKRVLTVHPDLPGLHVRLHAERTGDTSDIRSQR